MVLLVRRIRLLHNLKRQRSRMRKNEEQHDGFQKSPWDDVSGSVIKVWHRKHARPNLRKKLSPMSKHLVSGQMALKISWRPPAKTVRTRQEREFCAHLIQRSMNMSVDVNATYLKYEIHHVILWTLFYKYTKAIFRGYWQVAFTFRKGAPATVTFRFNEPTNGSAVISFEQLNHSTK